MTTAPDRKSTSMDEPPPAVPWPSIPMKAYGWPSSVLGHSEVCMRTVDRIHSMHFIVELSDHYKEDI